MPFSGLEDSSIHIMLFQRSEAVQYVDSSSPYLRRKFISYNNTILSHPIDIYTCRLEELENISFHDYWRQFIVIVKRSNFQKEIYMDQSGHLYKNTKMIRFTNYHPAYQTKGFFFNVLERCQFRKNMNF
ncbi:hypothetical protein O6H91_04G007700 [Diphasiastrum complanatum]|uniref:Uncharacterized protein n=1 Tax=Diphasiastrum complanatum TaxID=34168 RepID=A0ACC2DU14_DIPCM|nr:hypothetical protein O6H91_04G007700 [Diphasiastrum complanatum]